MKASDPRAEWDRLERAAFSYFIEHRDAQSGLVYNTTEPGSPASPTACGMALSAIPIGVERGWITREEGSRIATQMLESLARAEQAHGMFYHFLEPSSGARAWQSEVSTIDSAILFAGAMVIAEYFKGTEVERLANQLIHRAEWPWWLNGEDTLKWAWRPESGFEGGPMEFSESLLAYLLAIGSPSHPIPPGSWDAIRRPITQETPNRRAMVYTPDGSLFAYLLPLAWFDLRNRHDASLDYWTNAIEAIRSNQAFCRANQRRYQTYRAGFWGLSAALGPDGYAAYGAMPGLRVVHDGTVSPSVVLASVPFVGEEALSTYWQMERAVPKLWTRYGPGDAFNLDRRFVSPHAIALDQGLILLMLENLRTGMIWTLFMNHPIAQRAVSLAGFVPGRLEAPRSPAVIPGNPGASLTVPMIDHAVSVDANLHEWIRQEAIELTPTNRRNVEFGFFHGAADASALLYLGWTPQRFYVAGIITDDELVAEHPGSEMFLDDCVELFWDLDGDGFQFDANPRDIQIGLAPSALAGAAELWAWGAIKSRPRDAEIALTRGEGRFVFELGIPMALLRGLKPGRPVRFSIAYHDRDRDGHVGKLQWSVDTASVPGKILFGEMTLVVHPVRPVQPVEPVQTDLTDLTGLTDQTGQAGLTDE